MASPRWPVRSRLSPYPRTPEHDVWGSRSRMIRRSHPRRGPPDIAPGSRLSHVTTREATCHCGQLSLRVTGDPFAVSICNCRACQRRTGSAFGMQAGFSADQVEIVGRFSDYSRVSDEADRKEHVFHFCPHCGSQVFYTEPTE